MNYLKIAVFFSALPSVHARERALTQLCDACTRFENLEFSLQPFTWSGRNVERTICSDGWRKPSSISHVFHLFCCRLPGIRPPHQRTPLVWGKGKSGTKKRGIVTMLWFWHVEIQTLLLEACKCLQVQKETSHSTWKYEMTSFYQ